MGERIGTLELSRRDGGRVCLALIRCAPDDCAAILALQDEIAKTVDPELFVCTTEAELRESLERDWCLAAEHEGTLAAFTLMVANRVSPRNAGTYLGYDEERLQGCVTYDTTFVHPAYRGYGLQRELGRLKDEAALALGAEEALSTISPKNGRSLSNALARGFELRDERVLYGGVRRYVMGKSLRWKGEANGSRDIS